MLFTLKKIVAKALAIYAFFAIFILVFSSMSSALAVEIDETMRTVPLNETGEQITLTVDQLSLGQQKFNNSCAQCHLDGGSKPNPDVDLSTRTLSNATPSRNSIVSMLDYLDNPTTYDGLRSLAELHPSTAHPEIFPRMRDLTQNDLSAIAGYILTQPKIIGEQWAGGKPKR